MNASSNPTPGSTDTFVFILAGGSGERFWPLSRHHLPKHLLKLFSDKTLLEETVRRLDGLVDPKQIFILTNEAQIEGIQAGVPGIHFENIIAEPAKRDTAPAATLANSIALSRNPNAVVVLLPADHIIHDHAAFRNTVSAAIEQAKKGSALITLGIKPAWASDGFGYLELGESLPAIGSTALFKVNRFVEKPNRQTAEEYLKSGNFRWNAGMFVWQASAFQAELEKHAPELAAFAKDFPKGDFGDYMRTHFPMLPKISLDYAIMEKASAVVAAEAGFDWDDVGAWTALPAHIPQDENQNTLKGLSLVMGGKNNIVFSTQRRVVVCGASDLVVVETTDAILVCHRDSVQKIKQVLPHLSPEEL